MLRLLTLYHDELFDYHAALSLAISWLERSPDDNTVLAHHVEALFASGQPGEAATLARQLAEMTPDGSSRELVFRGYEVASLLALDDVEGATNALGNLLQFVSAWPAESQPRWDYPGTRHFVATARELPHRQALANLFEALEAPGRDLIVQGLEQVAKDLGSTTASTHQPGDQP